MGGKTGGRKRGSKDSKKRNRRTLTEDEKTARKAKIRERNNSLANAAKRSFMSLFKTADKGILISNYLSTITKSPFECKLKLEIK